MMQEGWNVMIRIIFIAFVMFAAFSYPVEKEIIVVGALGQEGELISPQQIEEGPDGNIYVYDQFDGYIKVYSLNGKFIRKIGGEGQGPGEIQRRELVSFGFMPDESLYFTEYFSGHPWITIMEISGGFREVLHPVIMERFGTKKIFPLSGGNYIAELNFIGTPKKQKNYYLHSFPKRLYLLNSKLEIESLMLESENYSQISYFDYGRDTRLPFLPKFIWCPWESEMLLFSDGLSSKLQVYDFKGNLIKEIPAELTKSQKVTKSDLDEWRREWKERLLQIESGNWYRQFGKVIEEYSESIYPYKPIVENVTVTPIGNILVVGFSNTTKAKKEILLLDHTGKELSKAKLAVGSMSITKSFIFYTTMDEDLFVTVFCGKRKGNEKEDFLRVSRILEKKTNTG